MSARRSRHTYGGPAPPPQRRAACSSASTHRTGTDDRWGDDGRIDAAKRAGLDGMHAHRLRHTAATTMLHAGSPMAEVGHVRHRSPVATAIYAKGDYDALAVHARPWSIDAAGGVVTGTLQEGLADHLALRRALGYRLARPEKLLGQFLDTSTGLANRGSPCRRHWTGRVTHRRRAIVTAVGRVGLEPTTQGL